jgi:hypothetical protein
MKEKEINKDLGDSRASTVPITEKPIPIPPQTFQNSFRSHH